MRIPVLAYHAVNITGNDYHNNDHVAFAADLRLIDDLGLRIVPLQRVVDNLVGAADDDLAGCVALSCDDGSDFDYFNLTHPEHGEQRSLFNILNDFHAERGPEAQPDLHLTSFVIASPAARTQIDAACLGGADWMRDDWWTAAAMSGLMAIENHSLDHNHPALAEPGVDGMPRGSFLDVNNAARAEAEIAEAQRLISRLAAPHEPSLFCYPFGHVPEFLQREWLPAHGPALGLKAAFGDGAQPVTRDTDIWNIPRYICGWHWKSPAELEALLRS